MVVEAEIFPVVLTCLKDKDEYVKKNACTLIREIAKHTPEVKQGEKKSASKCNHTPLVLVIMQNISCWQGPGWCHMFWGFLTLSTLDVLDEMILLVGGCPYWRVNVQQHLWPLPTRCLWYPSPKLWQSEMSPGITNCLQGDKSAPTWEPLGCSNGVWVWNLSF